MSAELDRLLEPKAFAARGLRVSVETALSEWTRLAAVDEAGDDPARRVRVDVRFEPDESGAPLLEGEIGFRLRCSCQRCLEPLLLDLVARPKLFFGAENELGPSAAAAGFEHCEPEPGVTLRQLLEDEALLSIPVFPVHERSEDCGTLAEELAALGPADGGQKSSSPFAVLAELKRKN